MAFNPYTYVKNIYDLKGQWENANKSGDITTRDNAANQAQQYYQQLRDNGYRTVADQLQKSNYAQSKAINDTWAKKGKTSTRDYMYSLGQSKGMSQSEIDKLISWDNDTGEVSFGGKKIGTPDSVVDGVSYWGDTSVLDNAFNDYITRSGTVRSPELAVNQENEGLFSKYNQAYEDLTKTNPFTTAEAKAIMGKYDLAGLQARDNAVASGGASNGGNIDSYASANAMRQQSALVNQGQTAVLDAHKQKIDNIRGILSDMGVNIDRVFNQDQTAKNNEVARLSEQASVTGYIPTEWAIKNDDTYNQFLNTDGSFKKEMEGVDIQALIDQAKARGDNDTATKLAVVRGRKILGNYKDYGQYINQGDVSFMSPERTSNHYLEEKAIDSAEKINTDNNQTSITNTNTEANASKYAVDKEYEVAMAQIKAAADEGNYAAGELNGFLGGWSESDIGPRKFITNVIWQDYINNGVTPEPEILKDLIVENTSKYNIDVEDARRICDFFDIPTDWLKNYRDRTDEESVEVDGEIIEGQYAGMIKK